MTARKPAPTIRTIWGLAKSKELQLSGEDLHGLVFTVTGKDHISQLNQREIRDVVSRLAELKGKRMQREPGRRNFTDGGNRGTVRQRRLVWKLMEELGWEERQVHGMARKMYGTDRVEWLNYGQCSGLIEAMKAMLERRASCSDG